jgi:predicted nucleic acid-binding protein
MKYTLDTNCIIDLEEKRPDAINLKKMIDEHKAGIIQLAVVAISASENQPEGRISKTYDNFLKKLADTGLQNVVQLQPMAYWDVAYWGHAVYGDTNAKELEKKIHNILFPGTPIALYQDVNFPKRVWRNNKCDVQIAWAHAFYNQDVLVTRDENFHRHAQELKKVGVRSIIRPTEFGGGRC